MKRICIMFILASSIILFGCSGQTSTEIKESRDKILPLYEENQKEIQEKSSLEKLEDKYLDYELEEWKLENVESPSDVLWTGGKILVSDEKQDKLMEFDEQGNFIKVVGQTGSALGEFQKPTALAEYKGQYYVLDKGNNRVQIFDQELNAVREISLSTKNVTDPDYKMTSLAVNNSGVYVSGISLKESQIEKYVDDSVENIGDNFIGVVKESGDKVYAVNTLARTYDSSSKAYGAASGPNWLLSVDDTQLKKECELPNKLTITDFVIYDEKIVCVSLSAGAVLLMNSDGEYQYTIAYIDGIADEDSPKISVDAAGTYYIAMPKAGKIYRCSENN